MKPNSMDIRSDALPFPVIIGETYRLRVTLAESAGQPERTLERDFTAAAHVDAADGAYVRFIELAEP